MRTRNGVETKDCIFPFKFKGKTYASCTKDHTVNGKAWCATEVDSTGTVIEQKWGDCDSSCEESNQFCEQNDFFNENGRCIQRYKVEPQLQVQVVRYKIDENFGQDNNATNKCLGARSAKKCECKLTKIYDQLGEACESLGPGE